MNNTTHTHIHTHTHTSHRQIWTLLPTCIPWLPPPPFSNPSLPPALPPHTNLVQHVPGVYLPSCDHPLQEFTDYPIELESTVSALQADGPVMLAGDFNASLGCRRSCDFPNQAGQLLFEAICRCDLYVASLSEGTAGEQYAYANGCHHTTVDYC